VGKKINIDTNQLGEIGTRKYIYVGDVAKAVSMILFKISDKTINLDKGVEKFHISGINEYSNLDIVNLVSESLDREPITTLGPSPRRGYDLRYDLNSEKIRKLGWLESKSVPEIINETVMWTIKRPHWLE
jgi:dTDP-D-glucose 4,6-dehydratase